MKDCSRSTTSRRRFVEQSSLLRGAFEQCGHAHQRDTAAFNLSELLPGDEQVEEARDALSAPSAKLMETVASAIKDDLSRVKDVLDIFVRTGMNKSSELLPQLEL